MNDWIDNAADAARIADDDEQRKAELIAVSDYWLKLRQQIDHDVAKINAHPRWLVALKDNPLRVIDCGLSHYQVEKNTITAVTVDIHNLGNQIAFEFLYTGMDFKPRRKPKEIWQVTAGENRILLTRNDVALFIPEQAAQHVLVPIVKVLTDEVTRK